MVFNKIKANMTITPMATKLMADKPKVNSIKIDIINAANSNIMHLKSRTSH